MPPRRAPGARSSPDPTDCANFQHGRLRSSDDQRHHFGTAMPSGGVHPINLPAHKSAGVRDAIKEAGARLWFLPKNSWIQPARAGVRQAKGAAARQGRANNRRPLGHRRPSRRSLHAFTPTECANYAGYDREINLTCSSIAIEKPSERRDKSSPIK